MTFKPEEIRENADILHFGEYFLAPLLAKVFLEISRVATHSEANQVLFPSREGWYLRKHWELCRSIDSEAFNIPSTYIYANRRISNRNYRVFSQDKRFDVCAQYYSGTLGNLFWARLGIAQEFANYVFLQEGLRPSDQISLPRDSHLALYLLDKLLLEEQIQLKLDESRKNYIRYLEKVIDKPVSIFCDIGYSGTVVEAISAITGKEIVPVFFQSHYSQTKTPYKSIKGQYTSSVLAPPAIPGSSQDVGKLAQLLEATFRAPESGLVEINNQLEPVFDGIQELSPTVLWALDLVHQGIGLGLQKIINLPNRVASVDILCQAAMQTFNRGSMLSFNEISSLFFEDAYTGGLNININ